MTQSNAGQDRHQGAVRRILAVTAVLATAMSIALVDAGSSFALWNASVVVGAGSLGSGTVGVTQQGFAAMGTDYSLGNLSVTSPVAVTNTGQRPPTSALRSASPSAHRQHSPRRSR